MCHAVCKAFKEAGLQCYNKNFGLKQLLEYEVSLKLKISVYVAMCSLEMSIYKLTRLQQVLIINSGIINLQ